MGEHDYSSWKSQIRSEIEAWEGEGPPSDEELWDLAAFEFETGASWIRDMPPEDQSIDAAKEDALQALVALEMLEERQ